MRLNESLNFLLHNKLNFQFIPRKSQILLPIERYQTKERRIQVETRNLLGSKQLFKKLSLRLFFPKIGYKSVAAWFWYQQHTGHI